MVDSSSDSNALVNKVPDVGDDNQNGSSHSSSTTTSLDGGSGKKSASSCQTGKLSTWELREERMATQKLHELSDSKLSEIEGQVSRYHHELKAGRRVRKIQMSFAEQVDVYRRKQLYKAGSICGPILAQDMIKGCDTLSQIEEKRKKGCLRLTDSQKSQLEDVLRHLTSERTKVADSMIWCMNHADNAEDIVEGIVDSLSDHQVPVQRKVSLLYLLSVILCNCSSRAANASCFRRCFERKMPQLFKDLRDTHQQINATLEAEYFERQVLAMFHIWEECAIYTSDFLVTLENIFRGLIPVTPADLEGRGDGEHVSLRYYDAESELHIVQDWFRVVTPPLDKDDVALKLLEAEAKSLSEDMVACLDRAKTSDKTVPGLLKAECLVVSMYVDDSSEQAFYKRFNSDSAKRSWLNYKVYSTLLTSALRKLAAIDPISPDSTLFRELVSWPNGQKAGRLYWKTFSSTSLDRSVAENFAGPSGMVLEFRPPASRCAARVGAFSVFGEDEVLLLPFESFDVWDAYYPNFFFTSSDRQELVTEAKQARIWEIDNFDIGSHFNSAMGLIGLDNLGNTCFMSGALICLFNTQVLLEYCVCSDYKLDLNTESSALKGELMKTFVRVMEEMWRPGGAVRSVCSAVPLKEFKSCIAVYSTHFAGTRQHDAHDFFMCLIRGLHEDMNKVCEKKKVISHSDKVETISYMEKAKLSWDCYIECNNSVFVDLFAGQTRSAVTCTICGYESNTMEAFTTLSLPIREAQSQVSLSDCFEGFCIEETLKGTDKVKCAKCRKRRVCTKKMTVQRFPKILVLHLNRFGEDASKKLLTRVDCPLTGLNLSKFTTATDCSGTTYSLYAVCNHSGTPEKGHYKAYAMHPYSGQWHEFDDNRVTSIPLTTVNSAEVFLLFYERQDSDVSSTDSC